MTKSLFLSASLSLACSCFKWLWLKLAVLPHQEFDLAFGLIQLFPARTRKLHPFLEQSQSFFKGQLSLFQLVHNLL